MTTTIFTDNFTGTNGADWSSSYWSAKGSNTTTTNANATINASNQGKMTTSNGNYAIWERSNQADSLLTDFLVTLTKDVNARPYFAVVGINSTGAPTYSATPSASGLIPLNGAWVEIQGDVNNTSGAIKLYYRSNSGTINNATVPFSWANGSTFKIRVVQTATQIKVTCWTGTEPGTPTLTVTPTTMPLAGKPWLAVGNPSGGAGMGATTGVLFDDATYVTNDITVVNVNPTAAVSTATALMVDPAHTAGTGVSYTAAVGTATALATTPTITHIQNPAYSAAVATATALLVDPVVNPEIYTIFDTDTIGSQAADFADEGALATLRVAGYAGSYGNRVLASASGTGYAKIPDLTSRTKQDIVVAFVHDITVQMEYQGSLSYYEFSFADVGGVGYNVQKHLGGFQPGTEHSGNAGLSVGGWKYMRVTKNGSGYAVTVWNIGDSEPSPQYSFSDSTLTTGDTLVGTSGAIEFVSTETDGTFAPIFTLDKEIVAGVLTASAAMVDGVIGTGIGVTATALTASATLVDPAVLATATVTIAADVMSADETMPGGVAFTPDVHNFPAAFEASVEFVEPVVTAGTDISINAAPNTADAEMTDATFSNMTSINVTADAMRASAKLMYYSESEDPWINLILRDLSLEPADPYLGHYYKLNTASGTTVVDSSPMASGSTYTATWVGTPGLRAGTDDFDRYYTHFDGGTYLRLHQYDDQLMTGRTFEIAFRTTSSGTMSLWSGSSLQETQTLIDTNNIVSGAFLVNGRLYLTAEMWAAQPIPNADNLNDGNWHHIVVTDDTSFTEVHVDGKSVFIRYGQGGFGEPETVGAGYDGSSKFIGDISAFIEYESSTISRDFGALHYYAYMQATVISPSPATASADIGNAKGRGNQLRALGLYWRPDRLDLQELGIDWTNIYQNTSGVFGPVTNTAPFQMGPYIVFPKSIVQDEWNVADDIYENPYTSGYINDYDASPRYINLETDIPDITDYDMVFFIDAPAKNYQIEWESGGAINIPKTMNIEFERLMDSIRWAVDQGLSMWIPQPSVALEMGICSPRYDSSQWEGTYDAQATAEDYQHRAAREYYDFNFNNRLRIVSEIENLTDFGGWIRDEVGFWNNPAFTYSEAGGDASSYGGTYTGQMIDYFYYNLTERPDGLLIGDELDVARLQEGWVISGFRDTGVQDYIHQRDPYAVYGIDPTKPYVGTVVAKGRGEYYTGASDRTGSSADTIMALAVEKGTVLKGTPVGGRIFVYFNEGSPATLTYFEELNRSLPLQPPNSPIVSPFTFDTRRYLDRISVFTATQLNTLTINGKSGLEHITLSSTTTLPGDEVAEIYGSEIVTRQNYNMVTRGLIWAGAGESVAGEGDARVRVAAFTASATMGDAEHVTVRNVTVHVGAFRGSATITSPAEATEHDVNVVEFAMEASALMVGLPETIRPTPMTASTDMVWNDRMIDTEGEDIAFTLSNHSLEFYILEE